MKYNCPCCDSVKKDHIFITSTFPFSLKDTTIFDFCIHCDSTFQTTFITEDKKTYTKVKHYNVQNNSKAIAQV